MLNMYCTFLKRLVAFFFLFGLRTLFKNLYLFERMGIELKDPKFIGRPGNLKKIMFRPFT